MTPVAPKNPVRPKPASRRGLIQALVSHGESIAPLGYEQWELRHALGHLVAA